MPPHRIEIEFFATDADGAHAYYEAVRGAALAATYDHDALVTDLGMTPVIAQPA